MLMAVNSAVHTVLYGYYLLTSISPEYGNAWWKKYLTQLQLVSWGCVLPGCSPYGAIAHTLS